MFFPYSREAAPLFYRVKKVHRLPVICPCSREPPPLFYRAEKLTIYDGETRCFYLIRKTQFRASWSRRIGSGSGMSRALRRRQTV